MLEAAVLEPRSLPARQAGRERSAASDAFASLLEPAGPAPQSEAAPPQSASDAAPPSNREAGASSDRPQNQQRQGEGTKNPESGEGNAASPEPREQSTPAAASSPAEPANQAEEAGKQQAVASNVVSDAALNHAAPNSAVTAPSSSDMPQGTPSQAAAALSETPAGQVVAQTPAAAAAVLPAKQAEAKAPQGESNTTTAATSPNSVSPPQPQANGNKAKAPGAAPQPGKSQSTAESAGEAKGQPQTGVSPAVTPPQQAAEKPQQYPAARDQAAPNRLSAQPGPELAEAAKQGGAAATAPGSETSQERSAKPNPGLQQSDKQVGKAGQANGSERSPSEQPTAAQRSAELADRLANATTAERNFQAQLQRAAGAELQSSPKPTSNDATTTMAPQQQAANAAEAPLSASTAKPAPASPATQVAVQVHQAIADRQQRFSIRLEPAELGRVDVRLDFGRDGQIRAQVAAERPETLDLLQKDVHNLERALRDAGANGDKLSFSFDLQGGGRNAHGRQEQAEGDPRSGSSGEPDPEADSEAQPEQPGRRLDALVDIQV